MKILNICFDDYANFMYDQTKALKAVGLDATALKLKRHPFGYDRQCEVIEKREMVAQMMQADVIQIFHSHNICLELYKTHKPKAALTVWHTGTIYREDPVGVYNAFQNEGCKVHFTDQCEFLLQNNKLKYVATAVDVDSIIAMGFTPEIGSKFVIGHFPSKPEVKGYDQVVRMVRAFQQTNDKFIFQFSDEKVTHFKQIERMSKCDIYIELFKPELNGKPYGCFGVTAFEAGALGKVVVTQNINAGIYYDTYGEQCPIFFANTENDFRYCLASLASFSPASLLAHQRKTQQWIRANHSYEATGMRVKNLLFSALG